MVQGGMQVIQAMRYQTQEWVTSSFISFITRSLKLKISVTYLIAFFKQKDIKHFSSVHVPSKCLKITLFHNEAVHKQIIIRKLDLTLEKKAEMEPL